MIKQLLNSAFVGYKDFCRSQRVLFTKPKAEVDNTFFDLQNSSCPTQPHSTAIIANSPARYSSFVFNAKIVRFFSSEFSFFWATYVLKYQASKKNRTVITGDSN